MNTTCNTTDAGEGRRGGVYQIGIKIVTLRIREFSALNWILKYIFSMRHGNYKMKTLGLTIYPAIHLKVTRVFVSNKGKTFDVYRLFAFTRTK